MGLPGEGSQVASSLTLRWRVLAYRGGIAGSLEAEEGLGEDVHSEVPVDSLPAGTGDGGKAVSQGTWAPPEAGKGRTTVWVLPWSFQKWASTPRAAQGSQGGREML